MINKTALALVAALVAGPTSVALAADHHRDPATGLASHLYYQPLHELAQRGLPLSDRAKAWMKEHPVPGAPAARRGNARNNSGDALRARAQERVPGFDSGSRNLADPWQCIPQYDSAGVQTAPYCH
jgi:hypothetical protein